MDIVDLDRVLDEFEAKEELEIYANNAEHCKSGGTQPLSTRNEVSKRNSERDLPSERNALKSASRTSDSTEIHHLNTYDISDLSVDRDFALSGRNGDNCSDINGSGQRENGSDVLTSLCLPDFTLFTKPTESSIPPPDVIPSEKFLKRSSSPQTESSIASPENSPKIKLKECIFSNAVDCKTDLWNDSEPAKHGDYDVTTSLIDCPIDAAVAKGSDCLIATPSELFNDSRNNCLVTQSDDTGVPGRATNAESRNVSTDETATGGVVAAGEPPNVSDIDHNRSKPVGFDDPVEVTEAELDSYLDSLSISDKAAGLPDAILSAAEVLTSDITNVTKSDTDLPGEQTVSEELHVASKSTSRRSSTDLALAQPPAAKDRRSCSCDSTSAPTDPSELNKEDDENDLYVELAFDRPQAADPAAIDLKTELEQALSAANTSANSDSAFMVAEPASDVTVAQAASGSSEDGAARNSTACPTASEESTEQCGNPVGNTVARRSLVTIRTLDAESEAASSSSSVAEFKLTESELQLGRVQPVWIPDRDTLVCMLCEAKFTVIRRRHHCRACGRVLCNDCCCQKAKLPFMLTQEETSSPAKQKKDVRVCKSCADRLKKIEEYESRSSTGGETTSAAASSEQVESVPRPTSVESSTSTAGPTPPVVRPPVLKREGAAGRRQSEPKKVMFSDGITPGGDLTEAAPSSVSTPSQPVLPFAHRTGSAIGSSRLSTSKASVRSRELECFMHLPNASGSEGEGTTCWPPVIDVNGDLREITVEELSQTFSDADGKPASKGPAGATLVFALKKNLRVKVKLTEKTCCSNRTIWCFASEGLRNVSQDEILLAFERTNDGETLPPLDGLLYLNAAYEEALKGKPLGDLSYAVFSQMNFHPADKSAGYFDTKDNAGFLHFRPTYQCLENCCLPEQPFLVGVLIQKPEVLWAKVLPLRLLLRLGVEYRYYPFPISSNRARPPLFFEPGHTIMNLLNDMRSFTYTLASILGCSVTLENEKVLIQIPIDQYNQVLKILQSSNEHVLAWSASFHQTANAHLVCVQQPDTLMYQAQTINRQCNGRGVTGACFVVFNASLKAANITSRVSIVEDGVMIQIHTDAMERLRQSLHQQKRFSLQSASVKPNQITTTDVDEATSTTNVELEWITTVERVNRASLYSHVDGRLLTEVPRYRFHGDTLEATNGAVMIRLIELFVMNEGDNSTVEDEPDDLQSLVRQVASATSHALLPHARLLKETNRRTVAVRFAIGGDFVEFAVGSNQQPLPDNIISTLDDVLIPLLNRQAMSNSGVTSGAQNGNRFWRVELLLRLLDL